MERQASGASIVLRRHGAEVGACRTQGRRPRIMGSPDKQRCPAAVKGNDRVAYTYHLRRSWITPDLSIALTDRVHRGSNSGVRGSTQSPQWNVPLRSTAQPALCAAVVEEARFPRVLSIGSQSGHDPCMMRTNVIMHGPAGVIFILNPSSLSPLPCCSFAIP